ncbi:MAG TPA: gluconate 2-dehydrogenase, partial [Gammaproteobacteria bacterium]|nr:gluconate 2-dehydrogenase [Gammaproteobacteria bacterium]
MKKTKNKAPFHFPLADKLPSDPSRRALLKGAGIAGAVAVGASPTGAVLGAENQAEDVSNPLALEALETLTAAEAEVLEAICDCLIPSDEHGPGAKEARAAHYIDRSLA